MNLKDQIAFCGKRRAKHRGGTSSTTSVASPLLSQYNQAQHSHVLQDNQGNCYQVLASPKPKEEPSTISSNSSNLQCATCMVQWTTNNIKFHLSS